MLVDSNATPFDLKFRLFGFPIRVHPLFWLIMALLGDWTFRHPKYGPVYILLWVACGFLSILVHELGHALAARYYGCHSAILLYGFGGVAMYDRSPPSGWPRMLVALAGPAAGFLLLGIVVVTDLAIQWSSFGTVFSGLYWFLFIMNLFWGLFNLLPIWPLDGGKVCREVLYLVGVRRPDPTTHAISMVVAGLFAAYGVASFFNSVPAAVENVMPFRPSIMMTIFFILFVVDNYQLYQASTRRSAWED